MIKVGEKKGDFQIKAEIGKGGMGTIYYAVDTMLNREIALKVIHPQLANNSQLMERFKIEAMTQARMNHPNIVTIFSFSKIDDDNIIAMEYVEGKNLKDLLMEKRVLTVEEALGYLKQILKALEYSHSRNVIHRDIKPANILITEDKRVKLSDFGIAKVFGKQGLTKTGMLLGTPWYTPPEQILGEQIDFRSDLYSVGITFYEMITGTVPFDSETNSDFQIQKAHLETPPPRPSIYNPEIGSKIEKFILKALQKKPEKRFQSATEMLKAVELLDRKVAETTSIIRNKTVLSNRTTSGLKENRGKKTLLTVLSVLVVLLSITAAYIFFVKPSQQKKITPKISEKAVNTTENTDGTTAENKTGNIADSDINRPEDKNNLTKNQTIPLSSKTVKESPNNRNSSEEINKDTKDTKINKKKAVRNESKPSVHNSEKKIAYNKGPKQTEVKQKPVVNTSPPANTIPATNIDAELINLKTTLENGDLKQAEKKTSELLQKGVVSAKLFSFAGKVNFFKRDFTKAELYWKKAVEMGGSVNLRFFHKHGIFNKGCSGQLILKKNLIIFDSLTKPSHSIALTSDKIKKVEKPKSSFGIKISFVSKNTVKSSIFILRGRNRKGEKFLAEFINKYILGG